MIKKIIIFHKDLKSYNPINFASNHLMNEKYKFHHRLIVGGLIASFGVSISSIGEGYIHYIFEGVGYIIHGIGILPIMQRVEKLTGDYKHEQQPKEDQ